MATSSGRIYTPETKPGNVTKGRRIGTPESKRKGRRIGTPESKMKRINPNLAGKMRRAKPMMSKSSKIK